MTWPSVAICAGMHATSVWIDAPGEGEVRTCVFTQDSSALVLVNAQGDLGWGTLPLQRSVVKGVGGIRNGLEGLGRPSHY
jgi:hypothetical protein